MALYRSTGPNKTCDPRKGAKFDRTAIIWALLVEAH